MTSCCIIVANMIDNEENLDAAENKIKVMTLNLFPCMHGEHSLATSLSH